MFFLPLVLHPLLSKENVVGVGVGHKVKDGKETGDLSLCVFVNQKLDAQMLRVDDMIPESIGKFKTDVFETGDFFAGNKLSQANVDLNTDSEGVDIETLRTRIRPVKGGYSVGHYKITAGTMATAVYDRTPFPGVPRRFYLLSNNHVLANSNNAKIGDPILQPGPYDDGRYPQSLIARLSRFVPIRFNGPSNYVDAAIAEGAFHNLNREIYWIGYAKGLTSAKVGMLVQKTGRTTNYSTGRVTHVNASIRVNYGGGRWALFIRQILTSNMSAGGDSGSLLLDMNENACGLLFAGSSRLTVHNNIYYVQALLGVRIV